MKAYVFPGQGSQKKGMGAEFFDAYPELTQKADAILGYSIKDLCLNDPNGNLNQTQYTQPALYVVNALSYLQRKAETGEPDFVAGHSLGEFNALFAAGVFDFETGLKMVQFRGAMMSEARGGGMAAVIGLTQSQVQKVLDEAGLNTIDLANFNSLSQIVISGQKADIDLSKASFESAGAMFFPLNVSGAFHSRYMREAGVKFKDFINQFAFSEPKFKVIANVSSQTYRQADVSANLYEQIFNSVQWHESVRQMIANGVTEFVEVGPGNVLTRLIQKIQQEG